MMMKVFTVVAVAALASMNVDACEKTTCRKWEKEGGVCEDGYHFAHKWKKCYVNGDDEEHRFKYCDKRCCKKDMHTSSTVPTSTSTVPTSTATATGTSTGGVWWCEANPAYVPGHSGQRYTDDFCENHYCLESTDPITYPAQGCYYTGYTTAALDTKQCVCYSN